MIAPFERVAVLGPGLLGGSLALQDPERTCLWGRRAEVVQEARELGLEATTDLAEALQGADLVVLAVPVGVMGDLLRCAWPHFEPQALLTDVGSVKGRVHQVVSEVLGVEAGRFVGAHPMAGSEHTGLGQARRDLFTGAACVLTNDSGAAPAVLERVRHYWEARGMRLFEMEAAAHDEAVARISHFPHVMAVLAARVALKDPQLAELAGGGLRDTTRVASGDPAMWAGILTENHESLVGILEETQREMATMLALLRSRDQEGWRALLTEVKEVRDRSALVRSPWKV